jgi:WXG100 family type VII secretion target
MDGTTPLSPSPAGELAADHAAFRATVGDLRHAAELLRHQRDRAAREVEGLLGSGWRGTAATSYAEAWADWRHAADDVLAGLAAMASLLEAADARLADRDVAAGATLEHLRGRLG